MASYYNYIYKYGKPAKAVLVRLVNKSGQIVDTTTTDGFGYYQFVDIPQGTYDIRFYGNDLKSSDWLYDVQMINADDLQSDTLSGLSILAQIIPDKYFVKNTTGSISMEALLFKNSAIVPVGEISGYTWYANNNVLTGGIGVNTANITAAQISGVTTVSCWIYYEGTPYKAYVGLTDILDGETGAPGPAGEGTFAVSMTTDSGLIFKSSDGATYLPESITLTTNFYKASNLITNNDSIEYYWKLNGNHVLSGFGDTYRNFTIYPAMVSGIANIKCSVISGVDGPFTAEQSVTDVYDGTSYIPILESYTGDTMFSDASGTSPSLLVGRGVLYKEGLEVPSSDINYKWYWVDSAIMVHSGIGHDTAQITSGTITISSSVYNKAFPANSSKQLKVEMVYVPNSRQYTAYKTYNHFQPNTGVYTVDLQTPSGVVFYIDSQGNVSPENLLFSANLYNGPTLQTTNLTYTWYINDVVTGITSKNLALNHQNITNYANIKVGVSQSKSGYGTNPYSVGPFYDEVTAFDVQDGLDAIYTTITTNNGYAFVSGLTGYTPESITLSGTLYQGGTAVSNGVTFEWDLAGNTTPGATFQIFPQDINTSQRILCNATYAGNVYSNEITVFNIGTGQPGDDGTSALYLVPTVSGSTIFSHEKGTLSKITADLYLGNAIISPSNYSWTLDGVNPYGLIWNGTNRKTITLTSDDVDYTGNLKCTATISGITRSFQLDFLDLTDSIEIYELTPLIGNSVNTSHAISVSEVRKHYGYSSIGLGELLVTGLTCVQGHVKSFGLEYSPHNENNYKEIASFNVNIPSGVNYSKKFEFTGIPITLPNDILGQTYDFRLYAYNAFGTASLFWDTSNWTDNYLSYSGVQFIGQNFFRYTVPKLEVSDDGGQTWMSMSPNQREAVALKEPDVLLRWMDVSARDTALTQADLGTDYIEDWNGNYINNFSMSVEEIRSIKSYVVLAKLYLDRGQDFTSTNTATGIANDGPGVVAGLYSSAGDYKKYTSWRVLEKIDLDGPYSYSNDGYYYTSVYLPTGRMLSLHVYMLVDKAPIDVDDGTNKSKMKLNIAPQEFPI